MSDRPTVAVTTAEERYLRSPTGLSVDREPQEEPGATFDICRQLRDPVEAPQTVPNVDARPRQPPSRMAPTDDGATALRDRRIAEYEARLQESLPGSQLILQTALGHVTSSEHKG